MAATKVPPTLPPAVQRPPLMSAYTVAQVFAALMFMLVVRASRQFQDIQSALAFYGVYHANGWNQLIHFFGVPGIIYSALLFFTFLPVVDGVSWMTLFVAFYFFYYLSVDPFGGLMYTPMLCAWYFSAKYLYNKDMRAAKERTLAGFHKKTDVGINGDATAVTVPWYGTGKVFKYALAFHLLSWYVQLHPGHAVFEGAKPALTQSLGGAVTVAPLFAFYEGLWFVGINQELQNQTLSLVDQYTREMCQSGQIDIRACNQYN